jgi:signal transduction histidine kinase/FixJ family two-component response regulator
MNTKTDKILIIDDESRMCESLFELFDGSGYEVTVTQSSVEASKRIKEDGYSLIITDIKMPEVTGLDILKTAKEADPETVVILMTGYASLESSLEAIKCGAFEYLLKPVEFSQLEISVKRGLEARKTNLERRRLLEDLKLANMNLSSRLEEINALYEAGRSLQQATELKELLNKIVKLAAGVTEAELASVMLMDENNEHMTIEASMGMDPKLAKIVKLQIGSSIAGYVAQSGKPLIIKNVEKSSRFKRINRERYSSASLLCVPLIVNKRVLGVINMANKKDGRIFDNHDLKLLTTFASQAAAAIDDTRQFEANLQKLNEFSVLFELSKILSSVGSITAMRNAVFEYLKKLMPIDFALWFEWQPIQRRLKPVGAEGTSIPLTDSGSIDLEKAGSEELILDGISLEELHFDDIDQFSELLSKAVKESKAYPRPGINFTALPVIQEGELRYVFCISSIEDRKYTAQELSLASLIITQASGLYDREKALLNATRLLTMGNMISEISHDLRKPLTNIKGWVQILKDKYPEITEDANFFGMAEEEVQRLNELVTELVDFSKPIKYQTEIKDIRNTIKRAAELTGPEMNKKNISFIEEYADCSYEIAINKNQILEVFLNLFLNAIEATAQNGQISVTGKIGRPSFKNHDFLAITVTDNGLGISKENLSRIFDRYYTTKETGTGLGLVVVERIITAHGGTLEVNSRAGKGTNFTLYFPI